MDNNGIKYPVASTKERTDKKGRRRDNRVRVIHLGQYIGVRDTDEEKQSPRDSIDRRNGLGSVARRPMI